MKITRFGEYRFEKGDWVEMKDPGNIPYALRDKPRPIVGRVTNVNGEYVYVKPKYYKWEAEFYHSELLPLKKDLRKLKLKKIAVR